MSGVWVLWLLDLSADADELSHPESIFKLVKESDVDQFVVRLSPWDHKFSVQNLPGKEVNPSIFQSCDRVELFVILHSDSIFVVDFFELLEHFESSWAENAHNKLDMVVLCEREKIFCPIAVYWILKLVLLTFRPSFSNEMQ